VIHKEDKIYIAGHKGMVGSAIMRKFQAEGYSNIISRTHSQLDLMRQYEVEAFFDKEKPDCVILAAAKVGGIAANMTAPAEFLYDNLMIETNVINSAYTAKVKKLMFLASSCIYPRLCPQPMKEDYLLDGKLEPTNEGYALAKIIGIKLCEMYHKQYGCDFVSVMPCNIYGQGDNFDPVTSHVVAALILKTHKAKIANVSELVMWGTGNARRELMYVDDLADGCFFMLNKPLSEQFVNLGTGNDVSMSELIEVICSVVGYRGKIVYDTSKPDGMPQKLLDVSKAEELGWTYKTELQEGIEKTYQWFLNNVL
jgi:GDP-L-fucose synthase